MKKLIINADDFGYSSHTVDWTIKCFNAGVLSSATIMVNADAAERAVSFAKANTQWSFGLHLCLTDERPVCQPSDIPSLVTSDGMLLPTRVFMLRSILGLIKQADLKREIISQVTRLHEMGVNMSHLDGHGHMHRMPFVLRTLIQLKDEIGLTHMRPAQDLYFAKPRLPFGSWLNQTVNRKLFANFKSPHHFLMTTGKIGEEDYDWFGRSIQTLPEEMTEIGIHPGIDQPWRKLDTKFLLNKGKEILLKSGISLATYREIR
ncbi:MAG: ChbG/HpnK family deacetylase [Kiritimatiellae bacterium]|nr:ChbG/HpnK family deacetylase [Kiritimatiellia bacterium]